MFFGLQIRICLRDLEPTHTETGHRFILLAELVGSVPQRVHVPASAFRFVVEKVAAVPELRVVDNLLLKVDNCTGHVVCFRFTLRIKSVSVKLLFVLRQRWRPLADFYWTLPEKRLLNEALLAVECLSVRSDQSGFLRILGRARFRAKQVVRT